MTPATRSVPPLFSVLIATYNSGELLSGCLASILGQDMDAFEILIADGGSTDTTGDVIEAHAPHIAYSLSRKDKGPYDAWNSLLPRASGRWLMFLGADDRLAATDTLTRLAEHCASLPQRPEELSYVFGITEFVAGDDVIERFGERALPDDRQDPADDFALSHTGLLHHRDLFERFGEFSTDYAIAGDAHFLLRSLRDPGTRFYHAPVVVARMAAGGLSSGVASRVTCYREVEQARRELGIAPVRPAWLRSLQSRSAWASRIHALFGERGLLFAANIYRRLTGRPSRKHYR